MGDDMFDVYWAEDLEHDMSTAALCKCRLVESVMVEHKTESGVRLTLWGWDIDLTKMLVTTARTNALRVLFRYDLCQWCRRRHRGPRDMARLVSGCSLAGVSCTR